MRFTVLGPLTVSTPAGPVELASGASRTVLACLLLHRNTAVAADRLAEVLWGEQRPATATDSLRNHVMRLRRQLGAEAGARLRTVPLGYLLEVRSGEVDEDDFQDQVRRGREALDAGQWSTAAALLGSALDVWRGEPFAELGSVPEAAAHAQWLQETRLSALEGRNAADLRLGREARLVPELLGLTTRHPLRETFHGQLMLALARTGRQAEALDVFRRLRTTLVTELGVEPSGTLQRLHRAVLAGSVEPGSSDGFGDGFPGAPREQSSAPFRLPPDSRHFVGREDELSRLAALAAGSGSDEAPVVVTIVGTAGIGKSALAVRAAHRMRERFPDGQLFVDLRGHTPGTRPLDPAEALEQLLRTLGVAPLYVPADLDERAAFYRDRLADRRTLILLDNAADSTQVRPLLPGTPGSLVLVTSRRRLSGLDDAHPMVLGTLSGTDCVDLLARIAGPERLGRDQPVAKRLAALCGHLPLALRIAAARLRHDAALEVTDLVAELADEDFRLDGLATDDRSLRAVLEASAAALSPAELRMFRLLGLIPGGDFDAPAAAALDGRDPVGARRLLESLLGHNLLSEASARRYRFHDLARLYATALVQDAGPEEAGAARDRLLDYYLERAAAAGAVLARQRRPAQGSGRDQGQGQGSATPRAAATSGPSLAYPAASAWLRGELDNLLLAAQRAFDTRPNAAIDLAASMAPMLQHTGPYGQGLALHRAAAEAARAAADPLREANALADLGQLAQLTSDLAAATDAFERAMALYQELGEVQGEANLLCDLGRSRQMLGDLLAAEELHERALKLFRELGDRLGEANARCELGRIRMSTEDPRAGDDLDGALRLYRASDNELGIAKCLSETGRLRRHAGDKAAAEELLDESIRRFRALEFPIGEANCLFELARTVVGHDARHAESLLAQSLETYRRAGSRLGEANVLIEIAALRAADGAHPAAEELLDQALRIFQDLGSSVGAAYTLAELGRLRRRTGDLEAASGFFEQALATFRSTGDRKGESEILDELAGLTGRADQPQ
jgi:DNA-binding SARP family transcriptional activator